MRGAAFLAVLSFTWACDPEKQAAPPTKVAKDAPASPGSEAPAVDIAPKPLATSSSSTAAQATSPSTLPAVAPSPPKAPQAPDTPEPEPPARRIPGFGGAGTGHDIEEMFPDRLEELAEHEPLPEARKIVLLNEVSRRRDAAVTLRHIIATPDRAGEQQVFALYEYRLYRGCGGSPRPSHCPAPEEVELNPSCRAYGIVHARFPSAARAAEQGRSIHLMPLSDAACDLQIRHWFVAHLDANEQLDAYLEVVSSQVLNKEPGRKRPQITTEHRQLLYLWSGESEDDETDAEPSFFLDLGTWTVERWRQREPPVRESVVLFNGLQSGSGRRGLDFIQLLPCLDPWTDDACDPELRQRKHHSWGTPSSE